MKEDVELPSIQRRVKAIKGQVKAPEICKPYNQILFFFIRIRAYGIHSLAAFLYPTKLSFELQGALLPSFFFPRKSFWPELIKYVMDLT